MRTYSPSKSDENRQRVVLGYPSMEEYAYNNRPPPPPPSPPPMMFQPTKGIPYLSHNPQYTYSNAFNHLGYEHERSVSFGRMMLVLFVVLLAAMCLMSLIMWFIFGTHLPELTVDYLRVSNFSATNTTFQGLWEVDVSVINADTELCLKFEHFRSLILYKGVILGMSHAQAIEVERKQTKGVNFTVLAGEVRTMDSDMLGWSLPPLASDWNEGVVDFGVRLTMNANFSTHSMTYKQNGMRVFCDNMIVEFSSKGEGASKKGSPSRCVIRLRDGLD